MVGMQWFFNCFNHLFTLAEPADHAEHVDHAEPAEPVESAEPAEHAEHAELGCGHSKKGLGPWCPPTWSIVPLLFLFSCTSVLRAREPSSFFLVRLTAPPPQRTLLNTFFICMILFYMIYFLFGYNSSFFNAVTFPCAPTMRFSVFNSIYGLIFTMGS